MPGTTMPTSAPPQSPPHETAQTAAQWVGVELRHLATLRAVGEERSFRRAAERLRYVPSAVSHQIAALESTVGQLLVQRASGGGQVRLTVAGELLVEHASTILSRLHAAQADLVAHCGTRRGEIRVGVARGFSDSLLAGVIERLVEELPDIDLRIIEGSGTAGLHALVRRGEVDVAFGDAPTEPRTLAHRELLTDPYLLVVPGAGSFPPVAERPSIDEISALPLILPASDPLPLAHTSWRRFDAAAVAHVDSPACALALVEAGVGAAILTASTTRWLDGDIRAIDLTHVLAVRRTALIWHRERRLVDAVERFMSIDLQTADYVGAQRPDRGPEPRCELRAA
ncbi:MAG: hypothetical protein V7607_5455 [Solirubrobacteraceae bacterium]